MPFNGLSVLHDISVDELAKNHVNLIKEMAREIITIAAAYNRHMEMDYFEKLLFNTRSFIGYKTSMKNDYERKVALELEYIYGNPLTAATVKDVHCPQLSKLYKALKVLDLKNRNG